MVNQLPYRVQDPSREYISVLNIVCLGIYRLLFSVAWAECGELWSLG